MRDTPSFGQWLGQRRKAFGLTQEELAERMACSASLIRKLELSQRVASQGMADSLAELLGVAPEERTAFVQFARGRLSGDAAKLKLWQTLHSHSAQSQQAQQSHLTNLPVPLTVLIGREQELESLRKLLFTPNQRLLTLTGPPGIGKTRLGIEVGIRLLDHFEEGVFFVSLASINDPDLVPAAVAHALGVSDTGNVPSAEQLAQYLREKHLLLVLDNFEQVLDAAPFVLDLLGACPGLKVLITSREALYVQGEQQFQVPALYVADPKSLPPLQAMGSVPAIALFVERARAVRRGFVLTEENVSAIAAICARLDGLPLAIELAAARVKHFSPQEIYFHLASPDATENLTMLTSGPRDLPARQRTLRNAIEWSYKLLSKVEQTLVARLGVFVGSFTIAAALVVCKVDGDWPFGVPEEVESLIDKNLLKREEEVGGESYFMMLETLRAYSLEQLQTSGDLPTLRERHAQYYLGLAQEAASELDGEQQLVWLQRLDQAYQNIRAAIAWSISYEAGAVTALHFARPLHSYWLRRGYITDARNLLNGALARAGEVRSAEKARALYIAGRFATVQGDYLTSQRLLSESLDLYREVGDREGLRLVLSRMGTEYLRHRGAGQEQAQQALEEALAIAREIGNPTEISEALGSLANFILQLGDPREARRLFEESLSFAHQAQDKGLVATVLLSLGTIARLDGDFSRARSTFYESLDLFEASGVMMGRAFALINLGQISLKEKDLTTAGRHLAESLVLFQQMGHRLGLLECTAVFAALHLIKGDVPHAILLFSATQAAIDRHEAFLEKAEALLFEEYLAEARALASEAVWSSTWAEGQNLTLEQAVALALEAEPLVLGKESGHSNS